MSPQWRHPCLHSTMETWMSPLSPLGRRWWRQGYARIYRRRSRYYYYYYLDLGKREREKKMALSPLSPLLHQKVTPTRQLFFFATRPHMRVAQKKFCVQKGGIPPEKWRQWRQGT